LVIKPLDVIKHKAPLTYIEEQLYILRDVIQHIYFDKVFI